MFAKIKVNLTGDKSYYLHNGTELYYRQLSEAYVDVKAGGGKGYLLFSFFTLCAATLEYSLNFLLADYCIEQFGMDRYQTYLDEYLKLSFKNKLLMLPHILSNGQFAMNEDSASFKRLCEMINLRNKVLHNKEYLTEFELPLNLKVEDGYIVVPPGQENIEFQLTVKENAIEHLTQTNCLYFADALGEFKKLIMNPALNNELKSNKLLKRAYGSRG